jgi:hypothetical protein
MLIYMGVITVIRLMGLTNMGMPTMKSKMENSQLEINEIHKEEANVHRNRHAQG